MTAGYDPSPMPDSHEPAACAPPVRRFKTPGHVPLATTLGGLRQRIDQLDAQIVALLAQRALCVRDATRFKLNPFEVAAPARQAEVFEGVRALAALDPTFPGLPDIVESTYRTLVAGFVAAEGRFFHDTEPIDPPSP